MNCRLDTNPPKMQRRNETTDEDLGLGILQPPPPPPLCTNSCTSYKDLVWKKINETLLRLRPGLSLNPSRKEVDHSRCSMTTTEKKTFVTFITFVFVLFLSFVTGNSQVRQTTSNGIFIQLPYSSPPTVRPPPYSESSETCPAINLRENWVDTTCGDLNKGYIPSNPLGHKFPDGSSYPFEIIKNKTLAFFRHALPVLKSDKSLPKVARFNPYDDYQFSPTPTKSYRVRRSRRSSSHENYPEPTPWDQEMHATDLKVEGRANQYSRNRFCENPALGGLLCKMYNTMWGRTPHLYQQHQNPHHQRYDTPNQGGNGKRQYPQPNYPNAPAPTPQQYPYEALHQVEPSIVSPETNSNMPATPCPSSAEYLTPVFARNHEGAWRYVVQIPREGYFTQTVEVTKCAEVNCYYMDGTCRTSPRWQSLLVAELFYPDKAFPLTSPTGAEVEQGQGEVAEFQKYQRYIQKRKARAESGSTTGNDLSSDQIPPQCDGLDEIGCFQVRLFYDWFLIPGSCKCWRRQFDFTRVHQSR